MALKRAERPIEDEEFEGMDPDRPIKIKEKKQMRPCMRCNRKFISLNSVRHCRTCILVMTENDVTVYEAGNE